MEKLSQEALEARRAYQREWAKRNKDKVRAKNQRYWEKRARQREVQNEQKAAD